MSKKLTKFNYVIMSILLVILTAGIFITAFCVSTDEDSETAKNTLENTNNSTNSPEISELYNNTISQADVVVEEDENTDDDNDNREENNNDWSEDVVNDDTDNESIESSDDITESNTEEDSDEDTNLDRNISHNKSPDVLLMEEGRDYYIDSYYDDALKTLRKMIRLYPNSPYVKFSEIYIGKSLIGR
ncbi:MAG: hypothetical protein ACOCV8_05315, partial [Spirochaetota bacterium]